jgi:hypothetical protein
LKALSQFNNDSNYGLSSNFDRSVWNDLKPLNFYLLDSDVAVIIKTIYATAGQSGTQWGRWAELNAEESVSYFGSPFPVLAQQVFGYGTSEHLQKLGVMHTAGTMQATNASTPSEVNYVPGTPDKAN